MISLFFFDKSLPHYFVPCFFKNGHYLFLPLRFVSSYDSKFSIKQTLDKLEQLSSVSLDETRVQYILDAVDSARKAFPRQSNNKKKSVQQERISHRKDTGQYCTENDVSDQNGLVEERVSTIIKTMIIIIIIIIIRNNSKESLFSGNCMDSKEVLET